MTDECLHDILDRIASLHQFRRIQGKSNIQIYAVATTEDERCAIYVNADKVIMDYIIKQANSQIKEYINAVTALDEMGGEI